MSYLSFLEQIKRNAASINRDYRNSNANEAIKNCVNIDKFLDILYSLLKENNCTVDDPKDFSDVSQFLFTEEYPDTDATDAINTITYEIAKRAPASLSADAEPFQGTKHYRPMYVDEINDKIDGGNIVFYSQRYDNLITFRCWSTSSRHARNMALFLENFLTKYYYYLRQYVDVMVYVGRQESLTMSQYGDKRMVSIPMQFFIRTNEMHYVKQKELDKLPELQLKGINVLMDITSAT